MCSFTRSSTAAWQIDLYKTMDLSMICSPEFSGSAVTGGFLNELLSEVSSFLVTANPLRWISNLEGHFTSASSSLGQFYGLI